MLAHTELSIAEFVQCDVHLGDLAGHDNSGSPDAAAELYARDGSIVINRGAPWEGRARVAAMAARFFTDVPDLNLTCDGVRCAGDHVVYLWAFTGTHAGTKNLLHGLTGSLRAQPSP